MSVGSYANEWTTSWEQGLLIFSESSSRDLRADVLRRRNEFVHFLSAGRTLVVRLRPMPEYYIHSEQQSGGRLQIERVNLLLALPMHIELVQATGSRIEITGDGPIGKVLNNYRSHLRYHVYLSTRVGGALARIDGLDHVVAAVHGWSQGGGHIILLPSTDFLDYKLDDNLDDDLNDEGEEGSWPPEASAFEQDLLAAIAVLRRPLAVDRPTWVDQFATTQQLSLSEEVHALEKQIEESRLEMAALHQKVAIVESPRELFWGTGRSLELAVRDVLEILGGKVVEPPEGRDDWQVVFPEGDAVIEVKGVSKSAAEKHAAQLEKWVADAKAQGKSVKGILVVNTWREQPLNERTEEDFPQQMIPYSRRRQHCLVTGLQLFIIRHEVEQDPDRSAYWRTRLLNTDGPLSGVPEWQTVLHVTSSTQQDVSGK